MDLKIKDKVAIVTGSSSGVGKAIAFCAGGGRREGSLSITSKMRPRGLDFVNDALAAVGEIQQRYGTAAMAVAADLASEQQIVAMFDAVEAKLGPVDILVNNAAYCPKGPLTGYSVEEWNYTFQVNVTGSFVTCRELVKRGCAAVRRRARS